MEPVDLNSVFAHLWAKRLWILMAVLVCTAIATAAAFWLTPRYRAVAILVPATPEKGGAGLLGALGPLSGMASIAGIGLGSGDAATQEAMAVLKSRQFIEAFIRDRDLLPVLFADEWDAGAKRFRGKEEDWPTAADGFRMLDELCDLSRNKETGLVTLEVEWISPERAADWANSLVDRVNAEMRHRAIARSVSSLEYLEKELANTQAVETRQAISRLFEAQVNQRMLANVTLEYAFRFVDRAQPPEPDDHSWPPRPLFVVGGFLFGLLLSVGTILFLRAMRDTGRA